MNNPITELEQLTINGASRSFLKETAKWCQFLAIVGFIGIGLILIGSIFVGTAFNNLPTSQGLGMDFGPAMTIGYIVMAALYFFPVYYLYKFSSKMKKALYTKDDGDLAKAFEMLKSHYKFLGVFMIIILSLYALVFIGALFAGASAL